MVAVTATDSLAAKRRAFVVENFRDAAAVESYGKPMSLKAEDNENSPTMRVVVEQSGLQKQYLVAVSKPGILTQITNFASLGYFVKVAKAEITPLEGGRPVAEQKKTFSLGVVNSDSGMSVYSGGEKAVKWMLNRPTSLGQRLG